MRILFCEMKIWILSYIYCIVLLQTVTAVMLDTWHRWGSHCIRFGSHDDFFQYVNTDCVSNHEGQLTTIENAHKMEFIRDILNNGEVGVTGYKFVVGISLNTTVNEFRWSDGTAPLTEFWADGYPKYETDSTVAVLVYYIHQDTWFLIDQTKEVFMHFACEKPASLLNPGNIQHGLRSSNGRETTIVSMDMTNLCVHLSMIVRSKSACSRDCISVKCIIFGYERSTGRCVIFITREQDVCDTTSFSNSYKYYHMDDGLLYTCESGGITSNLLHNTPVAGGTLR